MIEFHQLGASVAAENLGSVVGFGHDHSLSGFAQDLRHVGEVVLGVCIVGLQPIDICEQRRNRKRIEPGINFANLALSRGARLLFDDGLDLIGLHSWSLANDAAVAGGICKLSAENGHCGLLLLVKVSQLANGFRSDQRRVAREHNHRVVVCQRWARAQERVTGAALRLLQHELDAGVLNRLADALSLVADDSEDVCRGDDLLRRCDHVRQQRLASDLVKDFGMLRFQPRALASGHDRDGGPGSSCAIHALLSRSWSQVLHRFQYTPSRARLGRELDP